MRPLLTPIALAFLLSQPLAAQEPPAVPMTEAPAPPAVSPLGELPTLPAPETGAPESGDTMAGGTTVAGDAGGLVSPASAVAEPAEPTDLVSIVLRAHWVVKTVMAGLAAMVFLVLTVLLFKSVEIARAGGRLRKSFQLASTAEGIGGLSARLPAAPEAGAAMLRLIETELAALPDAIGQIEAEGLHERCRIGLRRVEATALYSLRSGVGLLAQIAATAPFIGLFGTVFGIMNAFLAIAATKTTSLSVVAPGIAEALLATAIGLAAAIPAVLVYNLLIRNIAGFRHRLEDVSALAERLLSREIDRRRLNATTERGP